MALLETILTVTVLVGIAALAVYVITQTLHLLVKIVGNSIGGLLLLLFAAFFGSSLGLNIALNLWTILLALFTGVFGVIILIAVQFLI